MADEPKIVFMNQNPGVVDWFYRGPSKSRAEELGWDIRFNETGGALDAEQWAEMVADCNALLTTWGSPKIDNAILAKNDALKIVAHVGGSVAAIVSDDLYDRAVTVHLNQWLTDADCDNVAAALNKVFDAYCTPDAGAAPWPAGGMRHDA